MLVDYIIEKQFYDRSEAAEIWSGDIDLIYTPDISDFEESQEYREEWIQIIRFQEYKTMRLFNLTEAGVQECEYPDFIFEYQALQELNEQRFMNSD